MENTPLSSGEQSKVTTFVVMMFAACAMFGAGVLPSVFLITGFVMARRNGDFAYIRTAVKACAVFFLLGAALAASRTVYNCATGRHCDSDDSVIFGIFALSFLGYCWAIWGLFLKPLAAHSEWVITNGVFASKPKVETAENAHPGIGIVKGGSFKSYSVADELQKWVNLKETGHVTEAEFEKARSKLLGR